MFNIQESFKKEVQFYELILPTLERFQKEENVADVLVHFPKFYGARYNFDGSSDVVDDDGIILIEDLSVRGKFFSNQLVTAFRFSYHSSIIIIKFNMDMLHNLLPSLLLI